MTATARPVTPGISITIAGSTPTSSSGIVMDATTMTQSTASSKAAGVPVTTANAQLAFIAVAAAAGVFGLVLL